ncbi:cytochrome P450 [Favolaschia claudopus]|uniref:Cytochrome P450 n=1 Tax=Favolaschia claudopus TaxID=2862362 RepID=A0AAW0CCK3_9AGAR
MSSTRLFLSALGVVFGASVLTSLFKILRWRLFSPFRYMPGPPNPSWVMGNFGRLTMARSQEWQARYGPTFKYHNFLSATHLYTVDTLALHRIVNRSDIYQKAPLVRFHLTSLLGRGLLAVEGDEHTQLRKIMSPAFGPSQIHALTPLFLDKSLELSDVWARQSQDESGWARIDVFAGLKAMTLDVIGLAGFNYEFHALDPNKQPTELDRAFKEVFMQTQARRVRPTAMLRARFPFLRMFLPAPKKLLAARETMKRIGMQLVQDAKTVIASGEKITDRKDLLSLLLQSNMAEDSQRLEDDVVVSQLPTFFVAGHETTSTATTWALYALALHPEVQKTLRAELQTMGTDSPSLEALNSLPYLDQVVREVMRVHSPVVFTSRMAMCDDVLPLETPYTDTRGVEHRDILMNKGQMIYIPVAALNLDTRIWGAHAAEFKPERWDAIPAEANAVPGVWSHLFSFLGGPHNCIGWRFSLAELKSLLYTLIRNFEFEMAVSPEQIEVGRTAVQRPMVVGELDKGTQMPLMLRKL